MQKKHFRKYVGNNGFSLIAVLHEFARVVFVIHVQSYNVSNVNVFVNI